MNRRALITGVTGQDGYYLSKLLLEKQYDVYGMIRRHQFDVDAFHSDVPDVKLIPGDLTDAASLESVIQKVKPHEVYNLGAQTHVKYSFDIPVQTALTNAIGPLYLLEALRLHSPYTRFYQASTSEMFGNSVDESGYQRETTRMEPVSPYGIAKLFAHNLVQYYRRTHQMFVVSGILFNHESPRRGLNFVTQRVVKGAVEIWRGKRDKLELGNLDARRDWGHAADYVLAMWLMLDTPVPADYVIATGITHSVRELCEHVFHQLDMDYQQHVVVDQSLLRPEEVHALCGDAVKARAVLGWTPQYSFETMMDEMVLYWKHRV